ncbi:MAG: hypothetical protein IGS48_15390 [Oscillatoriales cyanobacterium C42_A2020_001]|nr:hypothetical protein [Leptolyngbyaceae cyanobacterium C42_A2020_001]
MNSFFSSVSDRVTSLVKTLSVKRLIIVTLVGFFMLTSTACSSSYAADPRSDANQGSYTSSPYDKNNGPTRELYKPTQKREGGMNNYNDDPKYDRKAVKSEAEQYVNRVQENIDKNQARNPKDIVSNVKNRNPLDDKARESYESTKNSAEKLANDFSEGTRKGTQNVKENLDKARDNAPRVFNEAKRNAQGAADDVREGTESLFGGFQNAAERAGDAVQNR